MITKETIINPMMPHKSAIKAAREYYQRWNSKTSFEDDFNDCRDNGFVVVRPDIFWMGKIIDLAPIGAPRDPSWFIRMAVGDLSELLSTLPYLPKIAFCRKGDERLRVYPLVKFSKLIRAIKK